MSASNPTCGAVKDSIGSSTSKTKLQDSGSRNRSRNHRRMLDDSSDSSSDGFGPTSSKLGRNGNSNRNGNGAGTSKMHSNRSILGRRKSDRNSSSDSDSDIMLQMPVRNASTKTPARGSIGSESDDNSMRNSLRKRRKMSGLDDLSSSDPSDLDLKFKSRKGISKEIVIELSDDNDS